MKFLKWLLFLVLVGGLTYVVVAVPVAGRTILDRIRPREVAAPVNPTARNEPVVPKAPEKKTADQLTEKDRRELDRLIDSKLKQTEGDDPPRRGP